MKLNEIQDLLIKKMILQAVIAEGELEHNPDLVGLDVDTDREHPRARLQLVMIEEDIAAWEAVNGKAPESMSITFNEVGKEKAILECELDTTKPAPVFVRLNPIEFKTKLVRTGE